MGGLDVIFLVFFVVFAKLSKTEILGPE